MTRLRAVAQDGETDSTVYRGIAVLCMRYGDFGGHGSDVSISISHPQRHRVNTAVAVTFTLRTQLHRLAVAGDNHVIDREAIGVGIVRLVTRYLDDHHGADADVRIAVVTDAPNQITYVECRVRVIRRPQSLIVVMMTGACSSLTVTLKLQLGPAVLVQVTVVSPTGKKDLRRRL